MSATLAILLTSALVATNGGLLGSYLLSRRLSLLGDAIAHAVLPGIVLAYLLTDSRTGITVLLGAAACGLLATLLIEWLNERARLKQDSSMGVSFSLLFAVGIILLSYFASDVDLDQQCVLYGELEYVPLSMTSVFGLSLPRSLNMLVPTLVLGLVFLWLGRRALLLCAFDTEVAKSMGLPTRFWHYGLMALTSLSTVASFEHVGAILVLAYLVLPAAGAYLLTYHMPSMLGLSVLLGVLMALGGYYLAVWLNASIAGSTAVAGALLFALVFLLSPKTTPGQLARRMVA